MTKVQPGTIKNNFRALLFSKEAADQRRWPYTAIQEVTGIAGSTLAGWSQGSVKRYDGDTLASLCAFFGCQVGDLLEFTPAAEPAKAARRGKGQR